MRSRTIFSPAAVNVTLALQKDDAEALEQENIDIAEAISSNKPEVLHDEIECLPPTRHTASPEIAGIFSGCSRRRVEVASMFLCMMNVWPRVSTCTPMGSRTRTQQHSTQHQSLRNINKSFSLICDIITSSHCEVIQALLQTDKRVQVLNAKDLGSSYDRGVIHRNKRWAKKDAWKTLRIPSSDVFVCLSSH